MPMLNGKANNHPVAIAIEPLRAAAVAMAREHAQSDIVAVREKLEAAGWDFRKAFPEPRWDDRNYKWLKFAQAEARAMVIPVGERSYMPKAPMFVNMDIEGCARHVVQAEQAADAQYELYALKLIGKIGDCNTAELTREFGGVWGDSLLVVTKGAVLTPSFVTERWHTQMIVNRSKLGKRFSQFPTRKLKPGRR